MTSVVLSLCSSCKRKTGNTTCLSFPEGIPEDILWGFADHRVPVDHEPVYDPDPARADLLAMWEDLSGHEAPEPVSPLEGLIASLSSTLAYNPRQARVPAGQRGGGRWTKGGIGALNLKVTGIAADLHNGFQAFVEPDDLPPLLDELRKEEVCNLANLQVLGKRNEACFRKHAREIPRDKMPQLPENLEGLKPFGEALGKRGIEMEIDEVDPRSLTATQNQLKSTQVAALYEAIKSGGWKEGTFIITDEDGNILDGHHRWAGASACVASGIDFKMPRVRVRTDIDTLIEIGDAMSGERKGMGGADIVAAAGEFVTPEPPDYVNPDEPWLYLWNLDRWVQVVTDTADGVESDLNYLQPFVPDVA